MTIKELMKHISSLNDHLLAYQNDNDFTVELNGEVIINLSVRELDQNDYDWYPERIHLGPYTTYRLFNLIKKYIDTPINDRGLIINNYYYVLNNHRYLVEAITDGYRCAFEFTDTWKSTGLSNYPDDIFFYRVNGNDLQSIKDSGIISLCDTLITTDKSEVQNDIEKHRNAYLLRERSN